MERAANRDPHRPVFGPWGGAAGSNPGKAPKTPQPRRGDRIFRDTSEHRTVRRVPSRRTLLAVARRKGAQSKGWRASTTHNLTNRNLVNQERGEAALKPSPKTDHATAPREPVMRFIAPEMDIAHKADAPASSAKSVTDRLPRAPVGS